MPSPVRAPFPARRRVLLTAATLLPLALAGAGGVRAEAASAPGKAAAAGASAAPATDSLCASYGAGFVRVPGTSTCMKMSASTQADTYSAGGTSSFSGNSAIAPALRSQ